MASFDRSHPCEAHYRVKLVLRILALFFSLIGLATGGYSWYFCLFLLVPFALSIIWNLANVIRRLTARTPVHPGANVALDLIIWLLFFCFLGLTYTIAAAAVYLAKSGNANHTSGTYTSTSFGGGSYVQTCDYDDKDGDLATCTFRGANGSELTINVDELKTRGGVAFASCVFGTASILFHFILFVIACVDTHRRRHADRYPAYQVNQKMAQFSYPQQ